MPNARTTDPQTSHEAAGRVRNVTEQQRAILNILTYNSITELFDELKPTK